MSKKKIARRLFNPEKYNLVLCNWCNGLGKIVDEENPLKVCESCGGFGLVKKQEPCCQEKGEGDS
jgi:DnaJ-class molecular chaperone